MNNKDELTGRTPTPRMIAAAWSVIDASKGGIQKLGPGLGVREIWEAMHDAALHPKQGTEI